MIVFLFTFQYLYLKKNPYQWTPNHIGTEVHSIDLIDEDKNVVSVENLTYPMHLAFNYNGRGGVVWHLSFTLINSFNKTEAAIFPMQMMCRRHGSAFLAQGHTLMSNVYACIKCQLHSSHILCKIFIKICSNV